MNKYLILMAVCFTMSGYAMQPVLATKIEQDMVTNDRNFRITDFAEKLQVYRHHPTQVLCRYILESYQMVDEHDVIVKESYDGTLTRLGMSIEAIEQSNPRNEGEDTFSVSVQRSRDQIVLNALKKMLDNYTPETRGVVVRIYGRIISDDIRDQADEELLSTHRQNDQFRLLFGSLKAYYSPPEVIQALEALPEECKKDGSFIVSSLLGVKVEDLSSARSRMFSSPSLEKPSTTNTKRIFLRSRERGRGGIIFSQAQADYSPWIQACVHEGKGSDDKNSILVPLTRNEIRNIRNYIQLIIDGGEEAFLFETLSELSIEQLAMLIKQTALLQVEVILSLAIARFVEKIWEIDNVYFADTKRLLESFSFSPEVQRRLSCLFYSPSAQNQLLSLLHTDLKTGRCSVIKKGMNDYIVTITHPDKRLDSTFDLWDVYGSMVASQIAVNGKVIDLEFGRAPSVLVCLPRAVRLIDLIGTDGDKKFTKNDMNGAPAEDVPFWGLRVSPDLSLAAIGCGTAIGLWHLQENRFEWLNVEDVRQVESGIMKFSSTGKTLLVYSAGNLTFWDIGSKKLLISHEYDQLNFVTVDYQGRFIVCGDDGTATVWSSAGERVSSFNLQGRVLCANSAGTLFIIDRDGACHLFNSETNRSMNIGRGYHACFSPDEKSIALFDENTIKISDRETGALIATLNDPEVMDLFFSSNGQHLIAVHEEFIRVWHYVDPRLDYVREPSVLGQAFLLSHCAKLLSLSDDKVVNISRALLQGADTGIRALSSLVMADQDIEVTQIANNDLQDEIEGRDLTFSWFGQGQELFKEKRYREALECFERFVKSTEGSQDSYKDELSIARFLIGKIYKEGLGDVPKDEKKAFSLFEKNVE